MISDIQNIVRSLLLLCALALPAGAQTNGTPVLFSTRSLVGGAAMNRAITITPVNPMITDGTNLLVSQPITRQPVNGTNITYLLPNDYWFTMDGFTFRLKFSVPSSTAVQSFINLQTNVPTYLYTNMPAGNGASSNNFVGQLNSGSQLYPPLGSGAFSAQGLSEVDLLVTNYYLTTTNTLPQRSVSFNGRVQVINYVMDWRSFVFGGSTNPYILNLAAATNFPIVKLSTNGMPTAPTNGQILAYNINTHQFVPSNAPAASGGFNPTTGVEIISHYSPVALSSPYAYYNAHSVAAEIVFTLQTASSDNIEIDRSTGIGPHNISNPDTSSGMNIMSSMLVLPNETVTFTSAVGGSSIYEFQEIY